MLLEQNNAEMADSMKMEYSMLFIITKHNTLKLASGILLKDSKCNVVRSFSSNRSI